MKLHADCEVNFPVRILTKIGIRVSRITHARARAPWNRNYNKINLGRWMSAITAITALPLVRTSRILIKFSISLLIMMSRWTAMPCDIWKLTWYLRVFRWARVSKVGELTDPQIVAVPATLPRLGSAIRTN